MGMWGEENFDSDDALNVLGILISQIVAEVKKTYTLDRERLYGGRGEAKIVANIDILGTLFKEYKLYPDIQLDEVKSWKRDYLDTFDTVSSTDTDPESVESANRRRLIIEATFDRLYTILRKNINMAEHE